jgi:hypothetical protein
MSHIISPNDAVGDNALAKTDESASVDKDQELDIQHMKQRLDMLDQRLDNIDSIVTAVAERIMSQLVTLYITCPHCGKNIEIAVVGSQKPRR